MILAKSFGGPRHGHDHSPSIFQTSKDDWPSQFQRHRLSDIDDDHLISEVPAAAKELAGVAAGAVASELISRLASGKES